MTGFDETVPPDDDPSDDENATNDPAHDSVTPAVDDAPEPDEPQGQWGPTSDYGDG